MDGNLESTSPSKANRTASMNAFTLGIMPMSMMKSWQPITSKFMQLMWQSV